MTSPSRAHASPIVYVAPLPRLDTTSCPLCGAVELVLHGDGGFYAGHVRVRPCSWWRRLWGCREGRPHVHCQHAGCTARWVTAMAREH